MNNTTFNQAFILINSLHFEDNDVDYLSIMESDPYFYKKLRCRCKAKTKEDYFQGIKLFENYLDSNPNHALSFHFIACTYYFLNENDKALTYSNKAISTNPNNALFYNLRGNIYDDKYKSNKALRDYNKAIRIDPTISIAYSNRGSYYLSWDRLDKAKHDIKKAIFYNSNNEHAYYLFSILDLRNNNLQAALEKVNKAIEVDNKYIWGYRYRADLNEDLNNYEEAIADYTTYIQLTSGFTGIGYYYRGMTKFRHNEISGAIEDFVKCMEISPSAECESQLIAALENKSNKNAEEIKLFEYYQYSPFALGLKKR